MVLAELAAGRHCREEHAMLPRFRALLDRLNPYVLLWCIALLGEVYSTRELRELEVAADGYG